MCTHNGVGMALVVKPYVHHLIVTNIQAHARQHKFHHLNISEGGSLRSPTIITVNVIVLGH